jgi:hypothetical protein
MAAAGCATKFFRQLRPRKAALARSRSKTLRVQRERPVFRQVLERVRASAALPLKQACRPI